MTLKERWKHFTNGREPMELLGVISLILVVVVALCAFQVIALTARVYSLGNQVASTTAKLAEVTATANTLSGILDNERSTLASQLGGIQAQVGSVSGTVNTLQKLSATDPELLAKYSKVFFLSDTYAPARLSEIPEQYRYNANAPLQMIPEVLPSLEKMLDAASSTNTTIYVDSAYRSFNTQVALKENYKVTYGAGTANSFSADQGYSEHQLGTTVDFITTGQGGALNGFDQTASYTWLTQNAYKYGFVLSYPKNNGYYIYEPWHWRFVGVELATYLHTQNEYFYQLDQRTIDAYLANIFG